jgi:hypothetical protein
MLTLDFDCFYVVIKNFPSCFVIIYSIPNKGGCSVARLEEMLRMTSRLAGPFSIESVVESIDVTISDAIMIYQENADSLSNRVNLSYF